jgi:putative addiction module antidote
VTLQIRRIGNSTGFVLPKKLLARLGLEQGDEVVLVDSPDGFTVRKHQEVLDDGMAIACKAMKTYQNALRELAK